MYELLVLVHILSGMLWVGGGLMIMIAFQRIRALDGDAALDSTVSRVDRGASVVFAIAPPLVLLTGVGLVAWSNAWAFSQFWVYVSLALFLIAAVLGGVMGGRVEKEMRQAHAEGVVRSELLDRYQRLFWAEAPVLIALVALMVYKPGI